jgi:Prokaryotic Cytochrome C oxidase subunit IV
MTTTATDAPETPKAPATEDRTFTYVWIILSAITVLSWWLGHPRSGQAFDANVPITIAVLAIGFIKARLIIRYFMEVRTAPLWLRVSTDAWLVVLWGAILAMYFW